MIVYAVFFLVLGFVFGLGKLLPKKYAPIVFIAIAAAVAAIFNLIFGLLIFGELAIGYIVALAVIESYKKK